MSALVKAKALSLHLNDLGVSQEPVENGCSRRDISEELPPILSRSIGRNQSGSRFVTAHEYLQEIFRSAWTELLHAEVFKNKKIDVGELIDKSFAVRLWLRLRQSPEPGRRHCERWLGNRPGWRRLQWR